MRLPGKPCSCLGRFFCPVVLHAFPAYRFGNPLPRPGVHRFFRQVPAGALPGDGGVSVVRADVWHARRQGACPAPGGAAGSLLPAWRSKEKGRPALPDGPVFRRARTVRTFCGRAASSRHRTCRTWRRLLRSCALRGACRAVRGQGRRRASCPSQGFCGPHS